jgi:hypothetical protein
MRRIRYLLRTKSGAWSTHPAAHSPDYRLLSFTMTAERNGSKLGGNNIQVVIGAPDQQRRGLDGDVAVWLESGWWVTLRNQFAQPPDVAAQILTTLAGALSTITAEATDARGEDAQAVTAKLFSATFDAVGPDYW